MKLGKDVIQLTKDFVRSRLFGPKDYFERAKKRLAILYATLVGVGAIVPSFFAVAAVAFSDTPDGFRLNFSAAVESLADSPIAGIAFLLSNAAVICFFLGTNFYYGKVLKSSAETIDQIGERQRRADTWQENKKLLLSFFEEENLAAATTLSNHLLTNFSQQMNEDSEILRLAIESKIYDHLTWKIDEPAKPKLLPAPES